MAIACACSVLIGYLLLAADVILVAPPHSPLYVGAGLAVKAERIGTDRVAAVRRPDDGTFGMRVPPGRYRVNAEVDGRCWRGSHRRVRVAGDPVHLRLTVANVCIR